MTRPVWDRMTQPWSIRSGNAHTGTWQGDPSGSVQSAQSASSRANPRPSSMVSTSKRSSTSLSTMASCCWMSYTRTGLGSRPR